MKLYYLLSILILISCSTKENRKEKEVIKTSIDSDDSNNKEVIIQLFEEWKQNQITKGEFFANDSCNRDYYFNGDSLNEDAQFGIGFPDESEIYYKYGNLNKDNKIDALIYFTPVQCDGGNAVSNMSYEILVLSSTAGYKLKDDFFNGLNKGNAGFHRWDSIAPGKIYGTYFEFIDDDPRCCPSIQKTVRMDLISKKITTLKNKK